MYKYRNLSSNKNSDPANNLVGGWASTSRSLVATKYLKIWPRKSFHHHQNPHHTQQQISENLTAKVPSVKQEGEQGGGRQQCRNKNGAKTRWCDGIMSSDFLKMETFCHVTKNATCAKDRVEGNSKANMCVSKHACTWYSWSMIHKSHKDQHHDFHHYVGSWQSSLCSPKWSTSGAGWQFKQCSGGLSGSFLSLLLHHWAALQLYIVIFLTMMITIMRLALFISRLSYCGDDDESCQSGILYHHICRLFPKLIM